MSVFKSVRGMIIAVGCVAMLGACASLTPREAIDSTARSDAHIAREVQQIQNLMSRHAYYHAAGRLDEEFAMFAQRADISFGQNQGFMIGPQSIKRGFVNNTFQNRAAELARLSKLYPQLKNDPSNLGAGIFSVHAMTTSIIEIAQDDQTAKGMWYAPGASAMVDEKGNLAGDWAYERNAIDFIKENGQWKLWHVLVLADFWSPMGKELQPAPARMLPPSTADVKDAPATETSAPKGPQYDLPMLNSMPWSPTTVPTLEPRPPEPYRTLLKPLAMVLRPSPLRKVIQHESAQ